MTLKVKVNYSHPPPTPEQRKEKKRIVILTGADKRKMG